MNDYKLTQFFKKYHVFDLVILFILIAFFIASYWYPFLIYVSLLVGCSLISWQVFQQLYKGQISGEIFFILATVVGIASGQERAITVVILVGLFAHYIGHLIEEKAEYALEQLASLVPNTVTVRLDDGTHIIKSIDHIVPGMHVVITTGARVPIDGTIIHGQATLNESALTGESVAVQKTIGDVIYAGTFIEAGSCVCQVSKVGEETFFGYVLQLIAQAQNQKANIVLFTDKVAVIASCVFLVFIILVYVVTGNLYMITTLLVFGSPLELLIATPLTILTAIVACYRQGIVVKTGRALETMAYVNTIFFDKTGTLTFGLPEIVDITIYNSSYSLNEIITLAAIAEKYSGQLFARAVLACARGRGLSIDDPHSYKLINGYGIYMIYQNKDYYVGNAAFMTDIQYANADISNMPVCIHDNKLHTSFYLAQQGAILAAICMADAVRPEVAQAIRSLKNLGITPIILSGDRYDTVLSIGSKVGIDTVYAPLLPDQKLYMIEELSNNGRIAAMVGDGINDAPALKKAHVGIAMGAMGMEPAIAAADIVLMTNDLRKIVFIKETCNTMIRIIKQNLFIGLVFTHGIGIILGLLGLVTPIQAALFHAVPDTLIMLNATRLLWKSKKAII